MRLCLIRSDGGGGAAAARAMKLARGIFSFLSDGKTSRGGTAEEEEEERSAAGGPIIQVDPSQAGLGQWKVE